MTFMLVNFSFCDYNQLLEYLNACPSLQRWICMKLASEGRKQYQWYDHVLLIRQTSECASRLCTLPLTTKSFALF